MRVGNGDYAAGWLLSQLVPLRSWGSEAIFLRNGRVQVYRGRLDKDLYFQSSYYMIFPEGICSLFRTCRSFRLLFWDVVGEYECQYSHYPYETVYMTGATAVPRLNCGSQQPPARGHYYGAIQAVHGATRQLRASPRCRSPL